MKYQESIILLPCHSLEDFPVHHEGQEAQGLLANWTALWHPLLIGQTRSLPTWSRIDDPPEDLTDRLVVVPSVSLEELPTGFAERAEQDGAVLLRGATVRDEIIAEALRHIEQPHRTLDQHLVADFLGLGYCFLQVELLTRQMRYASNLDELHFKNQVVAAADAALADDGPLCKEKLTSCFDILAEERDHYYPVDAFIIDLVVVANTTIGAQLLDELQRPDPLNLLVSGEVVETMASSEPQSLDAVASALAQSSAALVGGEQVERALPLLSCETILRELERGHEAYQKHLGQSPTVFGRRRFGLTPALPQILHKFGFRGAVHATLDDGRFPEGMQIKTRWEGMDGLAIDALARAPLDATRPETYLNLAVKMGESMDMDHVATVCLAHWPGQSSPWLEDLRRIARYTSALGKFVTLDTYFQETEDPGQSDRFTADQYRSPYLKQAVAGGQPNAISSSVRYWRRSSKAHVVRSLDCLSDLVSGDVGRSSNELASELEESIDRESEGGATDDVDEQLLSAVQQAADRLASHLPRQDESPQAGYLLVNPFSFVRRIGAKVPDLEQLPDVERPVYAADDGPMGKHVVVDVPPMGFVWLTAGAGSKTRRRRRREPPPLAEDRTKQDGYYVLRNEFFEVLIDQTTGALRSLYEYRSRGNRLSQQLAFRLSTNAQASSPDAENIEQAAMNYSVMAADRIEISSSSTALGEITVAGRLLDRSASHLANFHQTYRLWRGSRLLSLAIKLEPLIEPDASDPWNSYFAARFAWADEGAELFRSVNGARQPVESKRFEAPQYIDVNVADGAQSTTILTGGLPYHRRQGYRMLDSLLIVKGESAREFQMGIGVDLARPQQEASSFLSDPIVIGQQAAAPAPSSFGWLFHVDARNITATHWEPLVENGAVTGFRARLLETAGRSSRITLDCFRPVSTARQVDFRNNSLGQCTVEDGRVRMDFAAGEWIELEARW